MAKHIWTIVCKEAKIEADTNNLSIIDVLENIQFNGSINETDLEANKGKALIVPLPMQVVSLFYRDTKSGEESFGIKVKVIDPYNKQLGEFDGVVRFQEGLNRMRSIMKFNGLAVTDSGTYLFQVFIKDGNKLNNVVTVPVDVKLDISKA